MRLPFRRVVDQSMVKGGGEEPGYIPPSIAEAKVYVDTTDGEYVNMYGRKSTDTIE
jgi:hypothetical protein